MMNERVGRTLYIRDYIVQLARNVHLQLKSRNSTAKKKILGNKNKEIRIKENLLKGFQKHEREGEKSSFEMVVSPDGRQRRRAA